MNDPLRDRALVIDVVLRAALAMDRQDWPLLRSCLAATLWVDYSAFRGTAPGPVSADDYVAARVSGLAGLRTLHTSTNHLVTLDGDRAACSSAFVIHRVDPARPAGEDFLDTAGRYEHGLARTADGWVIDRIVQTVVWSRGNPEVHGALRGR